VKKVYQIILKRMAQQTKKVLLAEDDKFISRAYQDGLARAGIQVIAAYDGKEALEKLRSEKPNMLLLDLIMPVKDGFEVLTEMNMDETLKKIPVIILSNLGQDSDMQKGAEMGVKKYLVKSDWSMKEVVKTVKLQLAKKK
jgi:two-component system, OmpR family, alkaline phosphatase synthesis response regulator PhoP